jgi:hypothetical protein
MGTAEMFWEYSLTQKRGIVKKFLNTVFLYLMVVLYVRLDYVMSFILSLCVFYARNKHN